MGLWLVPYFPAVPWSYEAGDPWMAGEPPHWSPYSFKYRYIPSLPHQKSPKVTTDQTTSKMSLPLFGLSADDQILFRLPMAGLISRDCLKATLNIVA